MKRSGIAGELQPSSAYIADLLPPEVLTDDPSAWRPPTAAEIRIVIGKDSETGLSGADAARLVGVFPQSFRKYTAVDGASAMSFAVWHLLLHRIGVKFATVAEHKMRPAKLARLKDSSI